MAEVTMSFTITPPNVQSSLQSTKFDTYPCSKSVNSKLPSTVIQTIHMLLIRKLIYLTFCSLSRVVQEPSFLMGGSRLVLFKEVKHFLAKQT